MARGWNPRGSEASGGRVRLLDVGCGPGEWHRALTHQRVAVVGVDLMPGMLLEARAAGSAFQPRPMLAQGDAQALPLRSATFDRALCAGVLYHVPKFSAS